MLWGERVEVGAKGSCFNFRLRVRDLGMQFMIRDLGECTASCRYFSCSPVGCPSGSPEVAFPSTERSTASPQPKIPKKESGDWNPKFQTRKPENPKTRNQGFGIQSQGPNPKPEYGNMEPDTQSPTSSTQNQEFGLRVWNLGSRVVSAELRGELAFGNRGFGPAPVKP